MVIDSFSTDQDALAKCSGDESRGTGQHRTAWEPVCGPVLADERKRGTLPLSVSVEKSDFALWAECREKEHNTGLQPPSAHAGPLIHGEV